MTQKEPPMSFRLKDKEVIHTYVSECGIFERPITYEETWDLMCGAFEGGSNYWVSHVELPGDTDLERKDWHSRFSQRAVKLPNDKYHSSLVGCRETNTYRWSHQIPFISGDGINDMKLVVDGEKHELGMTQVMRGIERMLEGKRHKRDWLTGNWDAITADAFLQYCLFGEIIYG